MARADATKAEGPWKWVAKEGLTGGDLIPLGARSNYPGEPGYTPGAPNDFDSHICFASRPVTVKTPAGSHEALYYMGGNGRAALPSPLVARSARSDARSTQRTTAPAILPSRWRHSAKMGSLACAARARPRSRWRAPVQSRARPLPAVM